MMKPRLKLAKSLLKDQGLIAISIDDNELHHLKLLMDSIFGYACHKGTLIIKKGAGIWTKKNIRKDHEYLLIYEKIEGMSQFYFPDQEVYKKKSPLIKGGKKGDVKNNKSLIYPILCPKHRREVWPITKKRVPKAWTIGQQRVKKDLEENNIFCQGDDKHCLLFRNYLSGDKKAFPSVWDINTGSGTIALNRDLGQNDLFDYPKSIKFLTNLFEYLSPADGLILDFFGGSGTTGCAVAELNKKNNSKRKFILVTNNQGDSYKTNTVCIFQDVLYPRLSNNSSKYQLSLKTFLLSQNLKEITSDDSFYSRQKEYMDTCFCLLSILKLNKVEWDQSQLKENNYVLIINGKKYGFFGSIGKDLDINMRFNFYLKK